MCCSTGHIQSLKVPSADSAQLPTYVKKSVEILLDHYGKDNSALTLNKEEVVRSAVVSLEVQMERITFCT